MAEQQIVRITVDDTEYDINFGRLTAKDAKDFRREVGVALTAALAHDEVDLDIIAGLIWLDKRVADPRLTFAKVAETITYGAELNIEELGSGT
jgi:hypothetical protein